MLLIFFVKLFLWVLKMCNICWLCVERKRKQAECIFKNLFNSWWRQKWKTTTNISFGESLRLKCKSHSAGFHRALRGGLYQGRSVLTAKVPNKYVPDRTGYVTAARSEETSVNISKTCVRAWILILEDAKPLARYSHQVPDNSTWPIVTSGFVSNQKYVTQLLTMGNQV